MRLSPKAKFIEFGEIVRRLRVLSFCGIFIPSVLAAVPDGHPVVLDIDREYIVEGQTATATATHGDGDYEFSIVENELGASLSGSGGTRTINGNFDVGGTVSITVYAADGSSDTKTIDVIRVQWTAFDSNSPKNRVSKGTEDSLNIRPDKNPESDDFGVSKLTVTLRTKPTKYLDDFKVNVSGMESEGSTSEADEATYTFSHQQDPKSENDNAVDYKASMTVPHEPTKTVHGDLEILIGKVCEDDCGCEAGGGSASSSSIDFLVSLGASMNGRESGTLRVYRSTPGEAIYDHTDLKWLVSPNIQLFPSRENPTQALSSEVFATVNDLEGDAFEIVTYPAGAVGEFDPETGLYSADEDAPFHYRFVFSNPDGSESGLQNSLFVEQFSPEGLQRSYLYEWIPEASNWTLFRDEGTFRETLFTIESEDSSAFTDVRKMQVFDGEGYRDGIEERSTYDRFPFGTRIRERVRGTGADAQITRWEYYRSVQQYGAGGVHGIGSPRLIEYPGGDWRYYEYDSEGRVRLEASAYGDSPFNGPASVMSTARTIETIRSSANPIETKITRHAGVEVAREFNVRTLADDGNSHTVTTYMANFPNALWDDPENRWRSTEQFSHATEFGGYPKALRSSNGRATLHTYERDEDGILITTERRGVLSGDPATSETFLSGTETVRRTDEAGTVTEEISSDIVTGEIVDGWMATEQDAFGRITRMEYLDGTFSTRAYGCCGIEVERDRNGVVSTYGYDGLNRRITESRYGILTTYEYDSDGRVIRTRSGPEGDLSIVSESDYDSSGRMLRSRTSAPGLNEGLVETTITYGNTPEGGQIITTTHPDGSTSVSLAYRDGSLRESGGTAAVARRRLIGVDPESGTVFEAIEVYDAAAAIPEEAARLVTQNISRMGQLIRTEFPDGAVSTIEYDREGRRIRSIDPDGVVELRSYEANGSISIAAVDMPSSSGGDRNGVIDLGGTDRITRTVSKSVLLEGMPAIRETTFVAPEEGSEELLAVRTTIRSRDGNRSESFGLGSGTTVYYRERPEGGDWKDRTETTISPDGTSTRSIYRDDLLVRTEWYTASTAEGAQELLTATDHQYDARRRRIATTDARTGTTTVEYSIGGQVIRTISPDPDGDGPLGPLESTYTYDSMGRPTSSTDPDGTTTHTTYTPRGEVAKQWGAGSYPVEYTYDFAGRKETMTTWQEFDLSTGEGLSGAAVTTWEYEDERGWLVKKSDSS
ncbi:MAG: RHS repeat domain-containing protein, partial [Puniceicoccaceae bacterium]